MMNISLGRVAIISALKKRPMDLKALRKATGSVKSEDIAYLINHRYICVKRTPGIDVARYHVVRLEKSGAFSLSAKAILEKNGMVSCRSSSKGFAKIIDIETGESIFHVTSKISDYDLKAILDYGHRRYTEGRIDEGHRAVEREAFEVRIPGNVSPKMGGFGKKRILSEKIRAALSKELEGFVGANNLVGVKFDVEEFNFGRCCDVHSGGMFFNYQRIDDQGVPTTLSIDDFAKAVACRIKEMHNKKRASR